MNMTTHQHVIGNLQYEPTTPTPDSPEWALSERVTLRHTQEGPVVEVQPPGEWVAGWVIGRVPGDPSKWRRPAKQANGPESLVAQPEPINHTPKPVAPVRPRPTFAVALKEFLRIAQRKVDEHWSEEGSKGPSPHLTFVAGHMYLKVVRSEGDEEHAHCFIDPRTGNILKSLSWKKIAPGVRGNIFDPDNGASGVDWSGAVRFR